ncbi:hypothetical protein HUA76_35740 [Myxococcus sp. CA056]|uniref:hypothetical protein n=1 Tax=Myxococcus sp. CA056 TaxID=2741740 RepID=UPI00157A4700|nr:hypothetical protein [Myxococcus sp. CA056]NTX16136.1 hypothetical protein [Myxococcus sp. CA056]
MRFERTRSIQKDWNRPRGFGVKHRPTYPAPAMRPILLLLLMLSACATSPSTSAGKKAAAAVAEPPSSAPSGPFGTAHRFGRWLMGCQAREDTNGDGAIVALDKKGRALQRSAPCGLRSCWYC